MKRGRKPKPTEVKRRAGNPGKWPLNEQEPEVPLAIPECPEHLDEMARAEWDRVCPVLFASGVMTELERGTLANYCICWSLVVQATRDVQKYGTILFSKERGTPFQSPYVNVLSMAIKQMNSLAVELGMTPSSRSRVQAVRPGRGAEKQGKGRFFNVVGA